VLHARSLLALAPPDQRAPRPHKSMEFLLDKDSAQTVQVSSFITNRLFIPLATSNVYKQRDRCRPSTPAAGRPERHLEICSLPIGT
jgi:hypothetical protein